MDVSCSHGLLAAGVAGPAVGAAPIGAQLPVHHRSHSSEQQQVVKHCGFFFLWDCIATQAHLKHLIHVGGERGGGFLRLKTHVQAWGLTWSSSSAPCAQFSPVAAPVWVLSMENSPSGTDCSSVGPHRTPFLPRACSREGSLWAAASFRPHSPAPVRGSSWAAASKSAQRVSSAAHKGRSAQRQSSIAHKGITGSAMAFSTGYRGIFALMPGALPALLLL